MAIAQSGFGRLALEVKFKGPLRHAMRLPAVAAAERVCAFAGLFGQQRLGNCAGRRQAQADRLLLEQHGFFTRDQGGVQIRLGKRRAAHHIAQKLHIGVQAHDAGLCQRLVHAGQRFFPCLAVHDQLGDHRVVEG